MGSKNGICEQSYSVTSRIVHSVSSGIVRIHRWLPQRDRTFSAHHCCPAARDDIDVAEYLITSMIGEPAAMLASPVNREDIMNGIPLIFHEQQAALPASTVVFTQQECAEAWNICLPIPSIPKKQKLSFLTEAEDAPGLDLIKLAGTILGEGKDEVYDTYLAWLKDFFKYDEMQLHHQKTCAVICTALTYAEIITQLEFDREELIST